MRKNKKTSAPNIEKNTKGRLRLFVAVELPAPVKRDIARLQEEIAETGIEAKWTAVENIHLTLKFLGNTPVSSIEDIGRQLVEAVSGVTPMVLRAQGLSVFPGPKRPRILWTGGGGETDKLARLQKRVDDQLCTIGFEKEERKFKAHLTLARFRDRVDPESVVSILSKYGGFVSDPFTVDAVYLIESRLSPGGPVYTRLQSHRFSEE